MRPTPDQLRQMLANDTHRIEQLQRTLEEERSALEKRDASTLPPLIDAKNQLMAALGENALLRQSWLEAAGLPKDHSGWQQWLRQDPETASQLDDWQTLADHFTHCRELNDINGKVIHRAQETLSQLLGLMRGQNNDGPALYNAQGRSRSDGGSGTLAKA